MLDIRTAKTVPTVVMSIKKLSEMHGIHYDADLGLRLGSLTTLYDLLHSDLARHYYPSLSHTAGRMGSVQIRNLATVGGNLCNASPASDLAPPLIALDATAKIIGPDGERIVVLESFFKGPGITSLEDNELLIEICIPPPSGITDYRKHSFGETKDIALVSVASRVILDAKQCTFARIVLGAVAPTPLRVRAAEDLLIGQEFDLDHIAAAAASAAEACAPIDDLRSSAWYRREMVKVLTHRSLRALQDTLTEVST
jgi:carbon-monoxide dehydrogenase medium subunit